MALRVTHKLTLLIAGLLALSLVSVSAVTAYDLRRGFAAFLAQRDAERAQNMAKLVASEISRAGGPQALAADPGTVDRLLRQFAQLSGEHSDPGLPPGMEPGVERLGGPSRIRGNPPMEIQTPQGVPWNGGLLADFVPTIRVPVIVDGHVAAVLRMRTAPTIPTRTEADFLRRQLINTARLALVLGLLGGFVAWLAARSAVRPLLQLQHATAQIAHGNFKVRLLPRGSDEFAMALVDINSMAQALERLEQTRREWLAQISHELRTPLAVLHGEIEAILDGVRPLDLAAMQSLQEESTRLATLIDDLNLVALSDLNALPCQFTRQDGASLAVDAVARFGARAQNAGLMLEAEELAAHLPLDCDRERIEQLFANLLENAIRYTASPGRIKVSARPLGDQILLRVEDSAPGVAAAHLPQLFDALFRADPSRSRELGGSGLGLTVCQAIVHAHHGEIIARPSELGGLRIDVILPADQDSL